MDSYLSSQETFDTFCSKSAGGLQTLEDVRAGAFLVILPLTVFLGYSIAEYP